MNVRLQKIYCVELLKTSFGTLTELEMKNLKYFFISEKHVSV